MLNNTNADWTRRSVSAATLGAIGAIAAGPTSALANTVTVSTTDQLTTALSRARGGETILIAPGEYGLVHVSRRQFPTRVRLAAQDARRPPKFPRIRIEDSSGVELSNLAVGDNLTPVNGKSFALIDIRGSNNVSVQSCTVKGVFEPGTTLSSDSGIGATNSQNISITNCDVSVCRFGIGATRSSNVTISGNRITRITDDGMRILQIENGLISSNRIENFQRRFDTHCDALQVFTSSSVGPCKSVVIRDNIISPGQGGDGTQGIFIRSETGALHENISIINNLVLVHQWHAISLSNTAGGIIRNNTAIAPADVVDPRNGSRRTPWIHVGTDSRDVLVERNISNNFTIRAGAQRIQHRENVQIHRSADGPRREMVPGTVARSYQEAFGTEKMGWNPPLSMLIPRAGLLGSSSVPVGFRQ